MPKKNAKKEKKDRLTQKQERFCEYYIQNNNITQAAIKAGYSKYTGAQTGNRLLNVPKIQNKINELKAETRERNKLKLDDVINELKTIAFNDPKQYFDRDYRLKTLEQIKQVETSRAIQAIEKTYNAQGVETIKIRFADKLKALEQLKHYFTEFETKQKQEKDVAEHFEKAVFILENTND